MIRAFRRMDAYSWGLLFFAQLALSRALLYTVAKDGPNNTFILDQIGEYVPLWFYAILWGMIGITLIVQAFRGKRANFAMVCLTGLFAAWGTFYAVAGFSTPQYLLSADLFLALAGLTGVFTKLMAMPRFRGG